MVEVSRWHAPPESERTAPSLRGSRPSAASRAGDGHVPFGPAGVTALQRLAGNRAVAQAITIQRAGPTPTPYEPDAPLVGKELGATDLKGGELPKFHVENEASKTGKGRTGKLTTTTKGSLDISTRYVAPGIHEDKPASNGTRRQLLVTEEVAKLVKEGEQEHSDDYWWTHELVAGEAARAINVLATKPAQDAENIGALHKLWREALHAEISAKLRITADASDPANGGSVTGPWSDAKAKLHQLTRERDTNGWHSIPTRGATPEERKAHNIPEKIFLSVTEPGGEIGPHKSEPRIRAGYDGLPDRP